MERNSSTRTVEIVCCWKAEDFHGRDRLDCRVTRSQLAYLQGRGSGRLRRCTSMSLLQQGLEDPASITLAVGMLDNGPD